MGAFRSSSRRSDWAVSCWAPIRYSFGLDGTQPRCTAKHSGRRLSAADDARHALYREAQLVLRAVVNRR